MQVERIKESKLLFDQPEPYNSDKLEKHLQEEDIKEVHVFKASPINILMATLRHRYPNVPRKKLRRLLAKIIRRQRKEGRKCK